VGDRLIGNGTLEKVKEVNKTGLFELSKQVSAFSRQETETPFFLRMGSGDF